MGKYRIALDVGGTFTDIILVAGDTGALSTGKTSSTPHDPSEGFFEGVAKVLAAAGVAPPSLETVFHGSTIATNAVLEGKGASTGMLVTDGFKYVLEIGRHEVPRKENLFSWIKPKRPVPPRRILEVPERVHLDGSVALPLDEARCREAARDLKRMGVESVAIVFIHSYANPAHERRAAEILREEFPQAQISLSSSVLPLFREYERSMATTLNAYIQPIVSRYIHKLEAGMKARAITAPLLLMKSNGGMLSPKLVDQQAISLGLSGPAAGVIGAGYIGQLTGHHNAITIDIGGTSADVCLVRDGRPQITSEGQIGPFPLHTPIVDIHTIGAGGGSIARITDQGSLTVGPRSAGAAPGPACYGKGGELPTVTDANLVLGRIPPHLLGGEIALDADLAHRAIHDHIAVPLGLDALSAAEGMLKIVNNNMVGALRIVSVERGYNPEDFALIAFGGAGPVHGGELAALLGVRTLVIPPYPGIMCALGLLSTDLQNDYVQTSVQRAGRYDLEGMEAIYARLTAEGAVELEAEGVGPGRRRFQRLADLRYAKQGFELTLPFPGEGVTAAAVETLVKDFHLSHEQLYTFSNPDADVEIVNLRVRALGLMEKLKLPEIEAVDKEAVANGAFPNPRQTRPVHFASANNGGFVETPVFQRTALLAGHSIAGPAIVDQLDSTTVVFPGQTALVDGYGNLIVTV